MEKRPLDKRSLKYYLHLVKEGKDYDEIRKELMAISGVDDATKKFWLSRVDNALTRQQQANVGRSRSTEVLIAGIVLIVIGIIVNLSNTNYFAIGAGLSGIALILSSRMIHNE